jgi:hypothetical protein
MNMADFEKREFPEINKTAYEITDDTGHTAQLSPAQAYELMRWLSNQGEELFRLAHGLLSYEESQRKNLCPYCSEPGERYHDPVLDLNQDFNAYRCADRHIFFVETRFLAQEQAE